MHAFCFTDTHSHTKFPPEKFQWELRKGGPTLAPYLLELLYLGLLKHGEDIGARLLSSPLSLIGGLLTCLRRGTQTRQVYTRIFVVVRGII